VLAAVEALFVVGSAVFVSALVMGVRQLGGGHKAHTTLLLYAIASFFFAALLVLLAVVMWRGAYEQATSRRVRIASWLLIATVVTPHLIACAYSLIVGDVRSLVMPAALPVAVGAALTAKARANKAR
jgi:hypothetical protein